MRNILLLISMLGLLPAGCGHTVSDTDTVSCDTFVYSVKGGDSLRLDRYTDPPAAEIDAKKPCMIFVFGGAFISGTRDAESYRPFFEYMAREQGYTVVSIDYRLGMKRARQAGLLDEEHFTQALDMTLSMATEDLYDATAYICRHMPDVDPSRIVTCGSSAGAITVLMGEYWLCNGHPLTAGKFTQDFSYAGVIAFAGAVCDTQDSLRWARDPAPMLLFHGDADRNVPYGALGVDGVWLFGSKSIADDLARRRVPHAFYSVAETNHSMAWRPMTENRGEIDSFLEKLVFKRQRLVTDVRITPLDAPAVPKDFGISDYIDANYGH